MVEVVIGGLGFGARQSGHRACGLCSDRPQRTRCCSLHDVRGAAAAVDRPSEKSHLRQQQPIRVEQASATHGARITSSEGETHRGSQAGGHPAGAPPLRYRARLIAWRQETGENTPNFACSCRTL